MVITLHSPSSVDRIPRRVENYRISITLCDGEDMWHAYNLVQPEDHIRATTFRKVQTESATGSTTADRVRVTLSIEVESTEFDTQSCMLRVKGRNVEENRYVKMGAYHTIDLELNRKFQLTKHEWDSVTIDRLRLACDPAQQCDVGAVVMQEGIANICLVTAAMTIPRQKIEHTIPRKRRGLGTQQHDRALDKFFDQIIAGMLRHFDFQQLKCVIIASPGFVKERFRDYLQAWSERHADTGGRKLLDARSKMLVVHSSSGFKHSLNEVLTDPTVQARLADTRASRQIQLIGEFFKTMNVDPHRAVYGIKAVELARDEGAVETLLVSDKLFRSMDLVRRKQYVELVDSVRQEGTGGSAEVFSSQHLSGEQLEQLGGIAALLRFPMPQLDRQFSDDESSADEAK